MNIPPCKTAIAAAQRPAAQRRARVPSGSGSGSGRRVLPAACRLSALLFALAAGLGGCGSAPDPVGAYLLPPMLGKPGPGQVSLCYNKYTESMEDLRRMVLEVCRDPRLLRNKVNLDSCSLLSPVEARFECAFVVRSLAEERPQMPLDAIR